MKRSHFLSIYLANIAIIVIFWLQSAHSLLEIGFGGSLVAIARLAGLLGAYSVLVQFVLISRARWLEAAFGFDRLTRIHRKNGILAFALISSHIPIMIGGTAKLNQISPPEQTQLFLFSFPYIWLAAIAYILLVITIILSVTVARKYLDYETWYYIHFINYAVVILAFFHQVTNGGTLLQNDTFRYYWFGLHGIILLNLIFYRFTRTVLLYVKHRFKVAKIEKEADGIYSVYVSGKQLDKFDYSGGQFAKWRFLSKDLWKEEHPFSISLEPNGKYLRLTVKAIGDYTSKINNLPPGTPVAVSGPFGVFTLGAAKKDKLLLIAGGIGITPLRSMLGMPQAKEKDIILLYSVKSHEEIAFKKELIKLSEITHAELHYILTKENKSGYKHGRINYEKLQELVNDLTEREVFLSGPPLMINAVEHDLLQNGISKDHIHSERFTLY